MAFDPDRGSGPAQFNAEEWLREQLGDAQQLSGTEEPMTELVTEVFSTLMRHMHTKRLDLGGFSTMKDTLQISVDGQKEGAVMYLRGRVNMESSPDLRDYLLAMLQQQSLPAITIDLAGVSYMDTSGIATLIEGLKVARISGIAMHLQGLQGRLLHLFQATRIGSLFDAGGPTNKVPTTEAL